LIVKYLEFHITSEVHVNRPVLTRVKTFRDFNRPVTAPFKFDRVANRTLFQKNGPEFF